MGGVGRGWTVNSEEFKSEWVQVHCDYIREHTNYKHIQFLQKCLENFCLKVSLNFDGIVGTTAESTCVALVQLVEKIFFQKAVEKNFISLTLDVFFVEC